jgi:signal transduction histidine kinase
MCELGLPVDLVVSGEPRPLPLGVDLTAYRIVQEAVTNTLKHGGHGVKARISLTYMPRSLDIEISDDGRGSPSAGTGHGLVGMTERAAIFGGTMSAGARPEGGFLVRVSLPLDAA